ncbi:aminodeoxychorismate/anthranilate synthase component II, partial [bacterium]|nr:aminodeoxychorismate/anthranilate synthase component II [bacterium]
MLKKFKQNILIIDNHDSFTYNLVQLIKLFCNNNFKIVKNTELDFNSINNFTHILISPGPG